MAVPGFEYCSPIEGTIVEHCKQNYKWTKSRGPFWKSASLQTFFVGNRRHFFEVDRRTQKIDNVQTDFEGAIQTLLEQGKMQDELDAKEAAKVDDDQLAIDNTPWMRKTCWARKCAGRDFIWTSFSHTHSEQGAR
jgi:hypothetical protein